MQRERALDADAKRLLADGERLASAVALALDHNALEDLRSATGPLDDLEVDPQAIARVEIRDTTELGALQIFDDGAHGSFYPPAAPALIRLGRESARGARGGLW
jgi:hypothetical protein